MESEKVRKLVEQLETAKAIRDELFSLADPSTLQPGPEMEEWLIKAEAIIKFSQDQLAKMKKENK